MRHVIPQVQPVGIMGMWYYQPTNHPVMVEPMTALQDVNRAVVETCDAAQRTKHGSDMENNDIDYVNFYILIRS